MTITEFRQRAFGSRPHPKLYKPGDSRPVSHTSGLHEAIEVCDVPGLAPMSKHEPLMHKIDRVRTTAQVLHWEARRAAKKAQGPTCRKDIKGAGPLKQNLSKDIRERIAEIAQDTRNNMMDAFIVRKHQ